jgi:DNA-binding Xre family transcriptional regulator
VEIPTGEVYRVRIVIKIDQLCKDRGITKKELSERAGIRYPALSEMKTRSVINIKMIEKIAKYFNIKDLREIIDLKE